MAVGWVKLPKQAPDSFVGKNYRFRPYFQQALAGQSGRYVAKGVTSTKLGYYMARPVTLDGKTIGVVVAKISFDTLSARLKEFWHQDEELNLVADTSRGQKPPNQSWHWQPGYGSEWQPGTSRPYKGGCANR